MILLILVFSCRSSNAITNYVSKFQVNQFIKIQGKTHFMKGVETNGRGNILLDGQAHRWTQKWTKCDRSTQIKVNRNYINPSFMWKYNILDQTISRVIL